MGVADHRKEWMVHYVWNGQARGSSPHYGESSALAERTRLLRLANKQGATLQVMAEHLPTGQTFSRERRCEGCKEAYAVLETFPLRGERRSQFTPRQLCDCCYDDWLYRFV